MAILDFLRNGKRGKCGDKIYQKNHGKYVSYDYSKPANPRTPAQVANRNNFARNTRIFRYLLENYPEYFTPADRARDTYTQLYHDNAEFIASLEGERWSIMYPRNTAHSLRVRRTSVGSAAVYVNFVTPHIFNRAIATEVQRTTLFFNRSGEVVDIGNINTIPAYTSYSSGGNRRTAFFFIAFFSFMQNNIFYRSNGASCPFLDDV